MDVVGIRLHSNPCRKHSMHATNYSSTDNVPTIINKFKIIV